MNNQDIVSCSFGGLGTITYQNPSVNNTCEFIVQLAYSAADSGVRGMAAALIFVSVTAFVWLAEAL